MSFSNTAETLVLNWLLTTGTATRPTAWYLALYTAAPGEAGGGTEVSTSGTAYVRKVAAFTVTGDTASNSGAIEFPTATASYGTVTHCAVHDAVTGGNLIAYATLTTSKVISTGDILRVPIGDLDITLD
tara:strand:+ start:4544 stop:4930 length:387 start_codon:yes stop_codon:yes gene_type:complete